MRTRTTILVAAVACLGAGTVALAADTGWQGRPPSVAWEKTQVPHGDPNEGRFVAIGGEFENLRYSCASCHGVDGAADASGAFPRLSGQSAWYLYKSLLDFASGRRPSEVMGPIAAELTNDEMLDVAAWYASRENVAWPPELRHGQGLLDEGKKIVSTGAPGAGVLPCSYCHGDSGVGNAPVYPFIAGQYHAYLKAQLKAFKAGTRGGDPENVMHQVAKEMSDHQIEAVAAYLSSLRPDEVTPGEGGAGAKKKPPEPLPMMTGAVISPKAGSDKTVLPDNAGAGKSGDAVSKDNGG